MSQLSQFLGGGGATYFKRGTRVVTDVAASTINSTGTGNSILTITAPTGKVLNIEYLRSDNSTYDCGGVETRLDNDVQGTNYIESRGADSSIENANIYSIGPFYHGTYRSGFSRRSDIKCKELKILKASGYNGYGFQVVYSVGEYVSA